MNCLAYIRHEVGNPAITLDTSLWDLDLDSLEMAYLFLSVEGYFSMRITGENIARFNTVRDLVDHVEERRR